MVMKPSPHMPRLHLLQHDDPKGYDENARICVCYYY